MDMLFIFKNALFLMATGFLSYKAIRWSKRIDVPGWVCAITVSSLMFCIVYSKLMPGFIYNLDRATLGIVSEAKNWLWVIATIVVTFYSIRVARKYNKSGFIGAFLGFTVMFSIMFWQLIPSFVVHKFNCIANAETVINKSAVQWLDENSDAIKTQWKPKRGENLYYGKIQFKTNVLDSMLEKTSAFKIEITDVASGEILLSTTDYREDLFASVLDWWRVTRHFNIYHGDLVMYCGGKEQADAYMEILKKARVEN